MWYLWSWDSFIVYTTSDGSSALAVRSVIHLARLRCYFLDILPLSQTTCNTMPFTSRHWYRCKEKKSEIPAALLPMPPPPARDRMVGDALYLQHVWERTSASVSRTTKTGNLYVHAPSCGPQIIICPGCLHSLDVVMWYEWELVNNHPAWLMLSKKWEVPMMSLWYIVSLLPTHLHTAVLFLRAPDDAAFPNDDDCSMPCMWHDDPLFYTKQALSIAAV